MEQLHLHSQLTTDHVQITLQLQSAPPFTQNTRYLAEKRDKQLAQYKRARQGRLQADVLTPSAEKISEALSSLAKLGLSVNEEDLGKLNPSDEFEEELELMAEVLAYFQVAYKVSHSPYH